MEIESFECKCSNKNRTQEKLLTEAKYGGGDIKVKITNTIDEWHA